MKILLTLCLSLFFASAQNIPNTKQLIVVSTKNWSTPNGMLQRYEKKNNSWHKLPKSLKKRVTVKHLQVSLR
jgi:D-alanyl-D-alanine dipeptidase